MKYIIFGFLLLASVSVKAQRSVPNNLKDSAFNAYVKFAKSIAAGAYDPDKDPYYPLRKECLGYCRSKKDSLAFENWIVDKWHAYQKEHSGVKL